MKQITLTKNRVALVDDEDFDRISTKKWRLQTNLDGRCYAAESGNPWIHMHRFLMDIEDSRIVVLHLNEDGLDNRRCNLRVGTNSDNQHVRFKDAKGYHWESSRRKWKAIIRINDKTVLLGRFNTEEEASAAYKAAKAVILARIFGVGETDTDDNEPREDDE